MADTTIKLLDDGPYLVSGSVEVQDAEGKRFATGDQIALCRCGHSANKPFCDGAHKANAFKDATRA